MAYGAEKRLQLRGLYVFKRLPMEAACAAMKLPGGTGKRWKADARAQGDDWDKVRAAHSLGDEAFGHLSRKLLEDYLVQHQAAMDHLKRDDKLTAAQRAEALSRLSDSFNKCMASFKRLSPDLNKHAIALDALQRLASFAQAKFPRHVPALLELLEPFGEELAKAYG